MTDQQTPTSEVLNRAADLIQERGWKLGDYTVETSDDTALCLEAAIALSHDGTTGDEAWRTANLCPAGAAVRSYLLMRPLATDNDLRSGDDSLWFWNDRKGRTADEVIAVLRAAALVEAANEQSARESQAAEVTA